MRITRKNTRILFLGRLLVGLFALTYLVITLKEFKVPELTTIGQNISFSSPLKTPRKPTEARGRRKIILYWNDFYGYRDFNWGEGNRPFISANCSVSNCFATSNRNYLPIARFDAILFHYPNLFRWPTRRSFDQHYVFVSREPPLYLKNRHGNKVLFFNLTMTYSAKSDFQLAYGRIWRRNSNIPQLQGGGNTLNKNYAEGKSKLVAWFASNCNSLSGRERYVQQLQKYINVDIYGRCGSLSCQNDVNHTCHTVMLKKNYKFYLAFENSFCDEYVTEKFFLPLGSDVVPIVLGGANYSSFAPPHSYIDALQFSPRDLAVYLKMLDQNDDEYNKFFRWKEKFYVEQAEFHSEIYREAFCNLCERLNRKENRKIYPSVERWWIEGKCKGV